MRLTSWANVCRFHLLQRLNYGVLPVGVLAFGFVVDVVVSELTPAGHVPDRYVGGLASIYVLVFVLGVQCVARYLTWLTSAVALALLFVFGTWFELVYRRWRIMGVVAFSAALTAVLAAGAVATTQAQAWAASATFSAPSACWA